MINELKRYRRNILKICSEETETDALTVSWLKKTGIEIPGPTLGNVVGEFKILNNERTEWMTYLLS
jgi:hypothetical protein